MARFTDKVAIVTGGASGIGKKTAEMFVEQGGKVLIGDVDDAGGQQVVTEIGTKFGKENISLLTRRLVWQEYN